MNFHSDDKLLVEIFSAPGCKQCDKAFQLMEKIVNDKYFISITLRKVNIVDELDYAIELGLLATPGIAINGQLIFTSIPSEKILRATLVSQMIDSHE
ncbi:MAG: glutaredoxin [Gammaproteobacteria bacterium]|nr:MAG: glutaredoxin [Gammaproteobacteria bacterium]